MSNPNQDPQSMMLVTSVYGNSQKTFKMVPITHDCPFIEVIFNDEYNVLAIISKEKKDNHFLVEKLDEAGEPEFSRSKNKVKKIRTTLEKYYEYYITEEKEIVEFINMFARNAFTFDYKSFFKKEEPTLLKNAA